MFKQTISSTEIKVKVKNACEELGIKIKQTLKDVTIDEIIILLLE